MKRVQAIMSGEATGLLAAAARGGLALAEPVYRAVVSARNKRFDNGKRTIARLPRPVISVGNITTGGTGKTPMVIHLARLLHEAGHRPAVLLRGYKADPEHPQASDEAAELTAALDGIAYVEANPNRVESARRVLDNHPNADVFLLDDGFQHRQVHRDLDMVLIDAMCPFGHDHLLPRGLLREPMKNLARADAVVVTRADQVEPGKLKEIDQRIVAMHGKPPIAHAAHVWQAFRRNYQRFEKPIEDIGDKRVLGVCGIGNPQAFERMLREHVREIADCNVTADHYAYSQRDLIRFVETAEKLACDAIVTTEKDWVKWQMLWRVIPEPPPVYRPKLGIHFLNGGDDIHTLITTAVRSATPNAALTSKARREERQATHGS